KDKIIQKRVIRRQNDSDLKWRHNAKANNPESPREKKHPHQHKLNPKRERNCSRMEPMRKMLHVPADPCGQRTILIVVVHRREVAPRGIAAPDFRHARFEIDPEPLPLQQKHTRARGWIASPQSRPESRGRKKQRYKTRFE